jgi:hypothetical protein
MNFEDNTMEAKSGHVVKNTDTKSVLELAPDAFINAE